MSPRTSTRILAAVAALVALTTAGATSIPAWLDDGISKYNAANPASKIRFVDIKDQYVWYDMDKTSEVGGKQIRTRINEIVLENGYKPMDDEEKVVTGRPPAKGAAKGQKKCWSRSFVLNLKAQSDTKAVGDESPGQRQRMLTSMVCEDSATWWAGFRTAG